MKEFQCRLGFWASCQPFREGVGTLVQQTKPEVIRTVHARHCHTLRFQPLNTYSPGIRWHDL